jgi:nitroimidazol reductase NimA-like FMN-containing flavoprotein (pyridoxamine 5'-phosphate oxidase superfamily)
MAPQLHTLTRRECEALLRSRDTGRMAVSTPQGPYIVPVGYGVVDTDGALAVVARIGAYSVLGTYGGGAMLAFEVDGVDATTGAPWSVVARGRGEVLHRAPEGSRLPAGQVWMSGPRSLFLQLRASELNGRLDAVPLAL